MPSRSAPPKKTIGDQIASIFIPICMFIGAAILYGFNVVVGVATKPYVDDRFQESRRYTDEKSAQTLKEAFEHSDANRKDMLLVLEQMNTDRQKNEATMQTKIDLVLRSVQEMRDAAWAHAQRPQK